MGLCRINQSSPVIIFWWLIFGVSSLIGYHVAWGSSFLNGHLIYKKRVKEINILLLKVLKRLSPLNITKLYKYHIFKLNWYCLRSYLRYLCLLEYSVVQNVLCCVLVLLAYYMLPVSLDCPFVLPLRYSLTFIFIVLWFCFVCLYLVYPKLPVTLDCPFLISPRVFSNIYFLIVPEHTHHILRWSILMCLDST